MRLRISLSLSLADASLSQTLAKNFFLSFSELVFLYLSNGRFGPFLVLFVSLFSFVPIWLLLLPPDIRCKNEERCYAMTNRVNILSLSLSLSLLSFSPSLNHPPPATPVALRACQPREETKKGHTPFNPSLSSISLSQLVRKRVWECACECVWVRESACAKKLILQQKVRQTKINFPVPVVRQKRDPIFFTQKRFRPKFRPKSPTSGPRPRPVTVRLITPDFILAQQHPGYAVFWLLKAKLQEVIVWIRLAKVLFERSTFTFLTSG